MCGPLALAAIPAATSAAGSITGYLGQSAAYGANKTAAGLTYAANQNDLATRAGQIDQQQSANTVEAAIARASAEGKVSASASSFGGDASTTARAANAASFSVGQQLGNEDINSENQRIGVAQDQTNDFIARQSQINKVAAPSAASLGVGLAGVAATGASTYAKLGGQFP